MARESSWVKQTDAWRDGLALEQPQRSLRVLIDARKLNHGGIGVYLDNLITSLIALGSPSVAVLADPAIVKSFEWVDSVEVIEERSKLYSLDELIRLPKRVNFASFDIYHTPHYLLPYGIPIPCVVTIHDLIHILHPERWYYPIVATPLLKSALKRAKLILTVSQASCDEILRFCGNDALIRAKLKIVSNTLDTEFLKSSGENTVLKRPTSISGDYFLAVISAHKPHKGVQDLLLAFKELCARAKISKRLGSEGTLKLALVGQGVERVLTDKRLGHILATMPMVRLIGQVEKKELISLYRGALALLTPSLVEGFSLPVLEAHAVGTPVIARPVPAVLEQLSSSDIVCEDFTIEALTAAMEMFLERDSTVRWGSEPLEQRILQRYSRENFVGALFQAYLDTVQSARGAA